MKRLIRYFFQGLLYLAPTGVTVYIVYLVFTLVDSVIRKYVDNIFHVDIPGIGVFVVLVVITLLGFLGQTILLRPLRMLIDKIMKSAPLVKVIYSSLKDLLSAFVGKEKRFNKPVLVKVNTISDLEKVGLLLRLTFQIWALKIRLRSIFHIHIIFQERCL